jgi:predicted nucleic acid-binding protein
LIVADTSIWVPHLHHGDPAMEARLDAVEILLHPYVLGEISLGNLPDRTSLLFRLGEIPRALVATEEEVARMIENLELYGAGIGYVDAHLVATSILIENAKLWTRDKRLLAVAQQLGIAADEPKVRLQ